MSGKSWTSTKARKELEKRLKETACEVWQDQPNTAVNLYISFGRQPYQAYGFAKVQWPDKWDAEYGVELAKRKARAKIAKRICSNVPAENH